MNRVMRKSKLERWFLRSVLYGAVIFVCPQLGAAGQVEVLSAESPQYQEVVPHVTRWMKGVLAENQQILINAGSPDDRDGIAKGLRDKNSDLYKILYTGKTSVFKFFRSAKSIDIALFRHTDLEQHGQGTTACYYDKGKIKPQWPNDYTDLAKLSDMKNVFCIFLFNSHSNWYVSYGFAEEEDGA